MADLAAGDVTYTQQGRLEKMEDGRRRAVMKIAFGDGALTYPSGGVSLASLSAKGFPNAVSEVLLMDMNDASGYVWKYNYETNKLRAWQAPAQTHAHDLLIKGGQAGSTTNDIAHYGTDILGKEAATDATIAKAASATKGGVMSEALAVAPLTELGNVAVAAQVLYAVVIGY